ncbi:ArsR family transcriptional regulator [Aeropyrum pernix]|uniref:ArsR family transcriptional regulator n=1 Tax=Aeropyrum pernix TaxID=56636 RepID=UPI0011E57E74
METANKSTTLFYTIALASLVAGAIAAVSAYRVRKGVDLEVEASIELDEGDREIIEALCSEPKTSGELISATRIQKTPLFRKLNKLVELGVVSYKRVGNVRVDYLIREAD